MSSKSEIRNIFKYETPNDQNQDTRSESVSSNVPKEVVPRFRHPKAARMKGVAVNGKEWKDFNPEKETITLQGLSGTVTVTAKY